MAKRLYFKDYYYLQGNNVHIHGVGSLKAPTGNIEQRPDVMEGALRFNTETQSWELGTLSELITLNTNNDGTSTFYPVDGGELRGNLLLKSDTDNRILNAHGSHTRLSYTFSGDDDTGFYRSSENTIDVVVGGEYNTSVPLLRMSRQGTGTGDYDQQLEINGDLIVQGTMTSVNSTDLEIEDNTITLNKNGTNSGRSGIEVEANSTIAARLYYDFSKDRWITAGKLFGDMPLPVQNSDLSNKEYVDIEINTLDTELTTVINNNYNTLNNKIDDEIARATNRENAIESNLNNEITRATGEEQRIEGRLDNEITRATNRENAIESNLNDEITRATNREDAIELALNNEVTRATNREDAIELALNNEVTRATGVEADLQQQIDAEELRATTREDNIDQALTSEITRATTREDAIELALNNEITRATGEEQRIESKIDSQITSSNNADADLQQQITDEVTRATNREDAIESDLNSEVTRATGVEAYLQQQINTKQDNLGFTPEDSANKSQPNGYASLDSNGKVPTNELPNSVFGGIVYQGGWDAENNMPALQTGTGTRGHYYKVNNANEDLSLNTTLDGENDWAVGDLVLFNGTNWEKFDQTDKVTSVRGTANTEPKVGDVVLNLQDLGASIYGADLSTSTDASNARNKLNLGDVSTYDVGTTEGQIPLRVVNGDLSGNLLGNATSASQLETTRNFTFTGDATGTSTFDGSSNFSVELTVQDDSHNHIISNVDGLQDALDNKLDGTATASDSDLLDGIDSTQFLRSDVEDVLTHADMGLGTGMIVGVNADGTVTHTGLVLQASTNPISGSRLLTVKSEGGSPRLIVEHDGSVKSSNSDIYVSVAKDGSGGNRVYHDNYHPVADALSSSIDISLSGDVTGTITTDLSGNTEIVTEVANDSHTHEWSNITSKPVGSKGEVYYFAEDGSTVEASKILHQLRIVDNPQQLIEEQQSVTSFEDVFNSWYRFSHGSTDTYPSDGSETNAWTYNSTTDTIECTINSATYIGFVSDLSYSTYIHEATVTSSDADNDMLGVVIAFDFDEDDLVTNNAFGDDPATYSWDVNTTDQQIPNEHSLSLVRMRSTEAHIQVGTTGVQYGIVYNFNKADEKIIANGDSLIDTVSGAFNGAESKVRIERNNDIIEVWTTEWSDSTSYDGTLKGKLTIDLTSDPDLEKFRGKKPYGYSSLSQPSSTYKDIVFANPEGKIYDVSTNTSWYYDGTQWVQEPTNNIQTEIGVGRLIQNPEYKDIYYIEDDTTVRKIYEYSNSNNYYTKTEIDNIASATRWSTEQVITSGGSQVYNLSNIFGTYLTDARDIIFDIKVLDNISGSATNGMWVDATAVSTYGVNTSTNEFTLINEYSTSLTFYIKAYI